MMDKLDIVIDTYIKENRKKCEDKYSEEHISEMEDALRERLKKQIVDKIKNDYSQEILKNANEEVQKRENIEKLNQLKSIMWTGFVIAFVVGLFVNQVTDIIGYFKGTVNLTHLLPTIVVGIVLFLICLVLYLYSFFKNIMDMYNDLKSKQNN